MRDHRLIDERSLAFGQLIAEKLAHDASLVEQARTTVERWLETCAPGVRSAFEEWQSALNGPIDGVIALLTERSERATRLRQSNPFAGILSSQERNAVLRQFAAYEKAGT
jgi:hypothetical protein